MAGQLRKDDIIQQAEIQAALKAIADSVQPVITGFEKVAAAGKKIADSVGGTATLKELITLAKMQADAEAKLVKGKKDLLDIQSKEIRNRKQLAQAKQAETRATIANTNATKAEEQAKQAKMRTERMEQQQIERTTNAKKRQGAAFSGLIKSIGVYGAAVFSLGRIVQFFTSDLLRMTETLNSLDYSLKTVIKSQQEQAQTQSFLSNLALSYGQDILTLTERYIKFRAAAQQSNVTVADTQKIFNSTAKAAAVLGLKTDEINGVFLALEQMLSKGKVTTEELRRQLGERLPGAFGIMADAMGVSIRELDKMLKSGEVLSSEALPKFAEALEKAYGIESVNTIDTLAAAHGRLKNSWVEFVRELNTSDTYIKVLNGLADAIADVKHAFGMGTELEKFIYQQNKAGAVTRTMIAELNKLDDKQFFDTLQESQTEWIKKLNESNVSVKRATEIFNDYLEMRKAGRIENEKTSVKLFDLEDYEKQLDKAKEETDSYAAQTDKTLKKHIIENSNMMSEQLTTYKSVLLAQDKELKNKQESLDKTIKAYEKMKETVVLSKQQQKNYEDFSANYLSITQARIEIANRLAAADGKEKKGKEKKDTRYQDAKAEMGLLVAIEEQRLARQAEIDGDSIEKERIRNEQLIQYKKELLLGLLQYVEKNSNEYYDILKQYEELATKAIEDNAKYREEIDKEWIKARKKTQERWSDEFIAGVYEEADLARIARAKQATEELSDSKLKIKEKRSIQIKSAMDMLQIEYDANQKIIDSTITTDQEKVKAAQRQKELREQLEKDLTEFLTEEERLRLAKAQKIIGDIAQVGGQFFDITSQLYENQLAKIEEYHKREIAAAGNSVEKRIQAERKYEREKAKIMRKQAIAEKANSAFSIIINTAAAIVEALPNVVLSTIIGALGAAQLATVLAAPIPKYAKGTDSAPQTFIAGEEGSEAIIKPSGDVVITPDRPTLYSDKSFVGSTIVPHDETQKMLANYAIKQSYDMVDMSNTNTLLNTIARNTRRNKEVIISGNKTIVKRGYVTSVIR